MYGLSPCVFNLAMFLYSYLFRCTYLISVPWGFWSYSMSNAPGLCSGFCSGNLSPLCFVALSPGVCVCIWYREYLFVPPQGFLLALCPGIPFFSSFTLSVRYVVQSWGIERHHLMTVDKLCSLTSGNLKTSFYLLSCGKTESRRGNLLTVFSWPVSCMLILPLENWLIFIKFVSKCLNSVTISKPKYLLNQVWSSFMPLPSKHCMYP